MSNEKSFDKYYIRLNRASGELEFDGDTPVLGELAKKDCRLEDRHVRILNASMKQSGVVYVEAKVAEVVEDIVDEKPVDIKSERKALFAEAKELGLDVPKNIKTDKLIQIIENEKA
jgi:hypothetical protein